MLKVNKINVFCQVNLGFFYNQSIKNKCKHTLKSSHTNKLWHNYVIQHVFEQFAQSVRIVQIRANGKCEYLLI